MSLKFLCFKIIIKKFEVINPEKMEEVLSKDFIEKEWLIEQINMNFLFEKEKDTCADECGKVVSQALRRDSSNYIPILMNMMLHKMIRGEKPHKYMAQIKEESYSMSSIDHIEAEFERWFNEHQRKRFLVTD
jgi:hypothetical protein